MGQKRSTGQERNRPVTFLTSQAFLFNESGVVAFATAVG